MSELKSLSHTHVAIMDYMMGNPSMALGDVAKHFGYTQPWLSQIVHSDAFQAMLATKQNIAFHHTVLPIREKMTVLAHAALDKQTELLKTEIDTRTVQNVADSMLDRLGYGAKPLGSQGGVTINQQNNFVVPNANAEEIARAREMLLSAKGSSLGVNVNGVSVPIAIPRENTPSMGSFIEGEVISQSDGKNVAGEGRVEI